MNDLSYSPFGLKDRQVLQTPPPMRIPIVSSVLHVVSMTVIVFLRGSFGYSYLRPRSVFFAFSWAFVLFSFYAWHERRVWAEYRLVCLFGLAAVALYFLHFFTALVRELRSQGEHDLLSGVPHTIRLLRSFGNGATPRFEMLWHTAFEPAFVMLAGILLRFGFGERHLSQWLIWVAPCLCLKEVLNFWYRIRHRKRYQDGQGETEEIFDDGGRSRSKSEPPRPIGKPKVKRARASSSSPMEEVKEREFAQILRLLPPYNLDIAEQNYKTLLKQYHPDPNEPTPENNSITAELNEAIAFFRLRKPQ